MPTGDGAPTSEETRTEATRLLEEITGGDRAKSEELFPLLYRELRGQAARYMGRERPDHTLQATALVHEAYLRLIQNPDREWRGREHFRAVAARAMREVLVDHARARLTVKRGSGEKPQPLEIDIPLGRVTTIEDMVQFDDLLEKLAALDARQASVVELRFFGGLTEPETAAVLGVSPRTVATDWAMARAWLSARLGDESPK